jgi:hypothetical protein
VWRRRTISFSKNQLDVMGFFRTVSVDGSGTHLLSPFSSLQQELRNRMIPFVLSWREI